MKKLLIIAAALSGLLAAPAFADDHEYDREKRVRKEAKHDEQRESKREREDAEQLRRQVLEEPMVKAAFEAFPDTELAGFDCDDERRN